MAIGIGEIFSLSCAIVWALAVVLFKRSGESLAPLDLNLFKSLLTLLVLFPVLLFIEGLQISHFSVAQWGWLLLSGVLGIGMSDSFYFAALNRLGASRMGIVASLYSPFVILLSILFLGEILQLWQYLGFLLVLIGVLLVSYRRRRREVSQSNLLSGVLLGVFAVFLNAVAIVMVKPVLETTPFFHSVAIRIFAGAVGLMLVLLWQGKLQNLPARLRLHHAWKNTITASLLGGGVSMVLWLAGYKYTSASIAAILNETASVFIVLFAWLILKEPLNWRRVAGISLTFTGVIIMLL